MAQPLRRCGLSRVRPRRRRRGVVHDGVYAYTPTALFSRNMRFLLYKQGGRHHLLQLRTPSLSETSTRRRLKMRTGRLTTACRQRHQI